MKHQPTTVPPGVPLPAEPWSLTCSIAALLVAVATVEAPLDKVVLEVIVDRMVEWAAEPDALGLALRRAGRWLGQVRLEVGDGANLQAVELQAALLASAPADLRVAILCDLWSVACVGTPTTHQAWAVHRAAHHLGLPDAHLTWPWGG